MKDHLPAEGASASLDVAGRDRVHVMLAGRRFGKALAGKIVEGSEPQEGRARVD